MGRPTDIVTYRVACTRLKSNVYSERHPKYREAPKTPQNEEWQRKEEKKKTGEKEKEKRKENKFVRTKMRPK